MSTRRFSLSATLVAAFVLAGAVHASSHAGPDVASSVNSSSHEMVFSGDEWIPKNTFVSTKTRAEVIAEGIASRQRGDYVFSGDEWVPKSNFVSTLTRAEVIAESVASRERGDYVFVADEWIPRRLAVHLPIHSNADTTVDRQSLARTRATLPVAGPTESTW